MKWQSYQSCEAFMFDEVAERSCNHTTERSFMFSASLRILSASDFIFSASLRILSASVLIFFTSYHILSAFARTYSTAKSNLRLAISAFTSPPEASGPRIAAPPTAPTTIFQMLYTEYSIIATKEPIATVSSLYLTLQTGGHQIKFVEDVITILVIWFIHPKMQLPIRQLGPSPGKKILQVLQLHLAKKILERKKEQYQIKLRISRI